MDGAPAGTVGDEGITPAELRLAARNHGLPLEALRHPITPAGLHYLLIHYDIPAVDPETFRLEFTGAVERPLTLTLDDLRARERISKPITFECAGNGRALLEPRPVSQPWLTEAVGTAEWSGARLAPLLEEVGVKSTARELLFTALDRGIEGGRGPDLRAGAPDRRGARRAARVRDERGSASAPARLSAAARGPRLVRDAEREVAHARDRARGALHGLPELGGLPDVRRGRRARGAGHAHAAAIADGAARGAGLHDAHSPPQPGPTTLTGRAWSGHGGIERVELSTDGGATFEAAVLEPAFAATAWRGWSFDWNATPGEYVLSSRATDASGNTQPLDPPWNLKGYANNAVERITVQVAP